MEWVGLDVKEIIRRGRGRVVRDVHGAGQQQLLWLIHKFVTWRIKCEAGFTACQKGKKKNTLLYKKLVQVFVFFQHVSINLCPLQDVRCNDASATSIHG